MTAIVKLRTTLAAGAMALTMGLAAGHHADAAQLRARVSIDGDYVRVGDIFTDLARDGDADLASARLIAAPDPGDDLTLSARHLDQIALNHGVDWHSVTGFEQAVITRPGRVVPFSEIEPLLRAELEGAGITVDGDIAITIAGRAPTITVPRNAAVLPRVIDFAHDERNGRFNAVIEVATRDGGYVRRTALSGRAVEVMEVPVLARRVDRGTVIGPGDIAYKTVDRKRVRDGFVRDAGDLIGMEAQRTLSADRPLRVRDIGEPTLVHRGDRVTMVYRLGGLTLSAAGRAQENGSAGADIRVINTRTKTTVVGVVAPDGTVTVGHAHQMAMN